MSGWYQIRRLRGAVFLILIGVLALLNQWNILSWSASWPLFLIVLGLLMLAERAAWTTEVRRQQEAQAFGSDAAARSAGPPATPSSAAQAPWSSSSSPAHNVETSPFMQTHPPAPEDPGREDR